MSLDLKSTANRLGDLNEDGIVNGADLALILDAWGACGPKDCAADIDGDDIVSGADPGLAKRCTIGPCTFSSSTSI